MNKKSIYVAAALSLAVLLVGGVALANNNEDSVSNKIEKKIEKVESKVKSWVDNDPEKSLGIGIGTQQESVVMRQDGSFRVTGVTVNSVNAGANTVNVNFYGFNRDVSLAGAEITGSGKTISISDIKAGDKLSGRGTFNKSTKVITVTKVLNVSHKKSQDTSNIESKINELLQLIEKLRAQLKSATSN